MVDLLFVTKVLTTILSSIFALLTIIIFNARTFRINVIERRSLISGRERVFSIVYILVLIPCIIMFCFGTEIKIQSYVPSLLNQIMWIVHFAICDILLSIAMVNRSHFRIFTYIPFILLLPCYYFIIIENLLTTLNLIIIIWFSLLSAISMFIVFLPPQIVVTDAERIDRVIICFV